MNREKTIARWASTDPEDRRQAAFDIGHALPSMTHQEICELQGALARCEACDHPYRAAILDLLSAFSDTKAVAENEAEGLAELQKDPIFVFLLRKIEKEGPICLEEICFDLSSPCEEKEAYPFLLKLHAAGFVEERKAHLPRYERLQMLTLQGESFVARLR